MVINEIISGLATRSIRRQNHLKSSCLKSSYIGISHFVRGQRVCVPRCAKQVRCLSNSRQNCGARDEQTPQDANQSANDARASEPPLNPEDVIRKYNTATMPLLKTDVYKKYTDFRELEEIALNFNGEDHGEIILTGYLGGARKANRNLHFGLLADPQMRHTIQIVAQNRGVPQPARNKQQDLHADEHPADELLEHTANNTSKEEHLTSAVDGDSTEGQNRRYQNSTADSKDIGKSSKAIASSDISTTTSTGSEAVSSDPIDTEGSNEATANSDTGIKSSTSSEAVSSDSTNIEGSSEAIASADFGTTPSTSSETPSGVNDTKSLEGVSISEDGSPDASSKATGAGNDEISTSSRDQLSSAIDTAAEDKTARSETSRPNASNKDREHVGTVSNVSAFSGLSLVLRNSSPHTPVTIWGKIRSRKAPEDRIPKALQRVRDPHFGNVRAFQTIEIEINRIRLHNENYLYKLREEVKFADEQRHLQLRTSGDLRYALRLRSRALTEIRKALFIDGFDEIETPLLFRSSREGAREFIVPSRNFGRAYALPQSPQQYKQILMASGIAKYFQFARCFRDEDLRTDRQPEFTQLDMEMSFADQRTIFMTMEKVIRKLWEVMKNPIAVKHYQYYAANNREHQASPFDELYYEDAMRSFGTDKPDRRIGSIIHQPEDIPQELINKITTIGNPVIDVMRFQVSDDPSVSRKFIARFLESDAGSPFRPNPVSAPGIFIVDESKPMQGLSALGFEAAEKVKKLLELQNGDLVVITARANERMRGSSTVMGDMRLALFKAAVQERHRVAPTRDDFVWITQFPLFELTTPDEPGQGGEAGIRARHHPFTAPSQRNPKALLNIINNPLALKGNSWDLVINGVEVGGGSVRIHRAEMQELIFRDVLKMSESDMKAFQPLLNALSAACPPHAGMALGFDRLLAVLLEKETIRDVMAFPKFGDGYDRMVGSPAPITTEQLETYGLRKTDHRSSEQKLPKIAFHKYIPPPNGRAVSP